MEKKIAHIRNKMLTVITLILALGAWQHEFIVEGIRAHVEMNLTILGTFAFSFVLAFVFVSKLKNEVVAFHALREMWADIQAERTGGDDDAMRRLARCTKPAKVFQRPRLLGHAYELVTDEVARTKKIRMSVETMNTLVNTIEQSIHDEKSMIVYLSGLLVFMGLIGTFIGLLHMVGAIGGIIGSLAQSAGGAGAMGAFQELLAALQEPLKGMASGFASSLFGLFSSLVVGLLGRFAGQAAGVLKREFEAWLAGLVKIGDESSVKHDVKVAGHAAGHAEHPALVRMVGGVLQDYGRLAGAFERVAANLDRMSEAQQAQAQDNARTAAEIARFCNLHTTMIEELQIAPALRELKQTMEWTVGPLAAQLKHDHESLRGAIDDMGRNQAAGLRAIASQQAASAAQFVGAIEMLSVEAERRSKTASPLELAQHIEGKISSGLQQIGHLLQSHAEQQAQRMTALDSANDRILGVLRTGAASPQSGSPYVERALDELNQTVSTAFSAYSSLMRVSLAALEKAGAEKEADDLRQTYETMRANGA
jgi:hypothetical protein